MTPNEVNPPKKVNPAIISVIVIALIALSSYVAKASRKPGKSLKEKAAQAEKVTVAAE